MMDEAEVSWSDLKSISLNIGPGSYTGLRVSTTLAKAYALSHNLTLRGYKAHEIVAHAYSHLDQPFDILVDANKRVVYQTSITPGNNTMDIQRVKLEDYQPGQGRLILLDNPNYKDIICDVAGIEVSQTAVYQLTAALQTHILSASLSQTSTQPHYLQPFYLNRPNITQRKKPLIS